MGNGDPQTDIRDRPPDPLAESPELPEPDGPITLLGFWDGTGRLYRSADHRSYVQIHAEDVQSFGQVDPGSVPFPADQKTWVKVGPDAHLEFVRTGPVRPADDLDIEVRFGGTGRAISAALGGKTTWVCTIKKWDADWPWPTFPFPFTYRQDG